MSYYYRLSLSPIGADMPFTMTITVYTVPDLCVELASRRHRDKPYTPAYIYKLLAAYWQERGSEQTRYLATEEDLEYLVRWRRKRGPKPKV